MDKKYQIFISSTFTDLIEERKKVRDTILSMLHFPVGMEIFGAADEEQWEIIKDTIDSSDYYVLIVGHRYGSVIEEGPDAGISYTEKEFRYAREQQIPILAFIIDDSVPVTPDKMEKKNPDKLEEFKADVKTGRLVQWWKNADDLAQMVSISLHKQMDRKKRPGWIRSAAFNIEESHAQLLELTRKVQKLEADNKRLTEELSVYQKDQNKRTPKLTVTINVDTIDDELGKACHPECAIQDESTFVSGIKSVWYSSIDKVREYYKPIKKEDFPSELVQFARQDEIDEYNASLPNEERIEKYATELNEYFQNTNGCVHINIGVHNDGTAKADSASVEIEFPEGVALFDDEILDLPQPEAPKLASNPIKLAEKRKKDRANFALNIGGTLPNYNIPGIVSALKGRSIADVIADNNKDYHIYDRTIDIACGTIIHTKSHWRRGIFVVGKKPGKYQIKCTLMCEEYSEPQIEYIDFEVQ